MTAGQRRLGADSCQYFFMEVTVKVPDELARKRKASAYTSGMGTRVCGIIREAVSEAS